MHVTPVSKAVFGLLVAVPTLVVGALIILSGSSQAELAGAALKAKKTVTLGETKNYPKPACPKKCAVVAAVAGFQSEDPKRQVPFKVPFDGRITGWKIFLGKPNREDRKLLDDRWGSPPQAAIAVLQKRKRSGKVEYELKRRSPTVSLGGKLGKSPYFKLKKPLRAVKGDQIALTVPTWVPAFAGNLNRKRNAWRAGRNPSRCNAADQRSTAQLKVGSIRPYGCRYIGGRLLYTVRLQAK